MAGGRHSRIWILAGLLAVCAAALATWGWVVNYRTMERARQLENENRKLQARVDKQMAEVVRLTNELRAAGEAVHEPSLPLGRGDADTTARVEAIHKLAQLQAQMQALNTSIGEAEAQNRQLDAQAASADAERARLAAATDDLANKLVVSNRTIKALEGQIKSNDQRLNPLEAENRQLQADEKAARTRLAGLTKLSRELADIRKRREALIEASVRHYRELGDQYRALVMRMDSAGDRGGPNPGDLSRIQAVLSQADDDLRQLSSLNQKAAALGKTLKF